MGMTIIGSVEVKATINTGFPWKVVPKGSRSSTRRASAPDSEPDFKFSAQGDSESEKLGVSVIGQHFADRVEHVPIKKRRFMVPPPSLLKNSTPCGDHPAGINHILPVSRLNPNLLGQKTAEIPDDNPDCSSHDFSAIKILAEVACSSGMSSDIASLVDGQLVEPVKHDDDALTLSAHVEGNDSSSGTDDVSGNDTTIESSVKVGEDKTKIIVSQKLLIDTLGNASAADQSEERIVASSGTIVAQNINVSISNESSTELPKETMEAGNSVSLAPQSESATVSEILSDDERTGKGKSTECLTDDRLHWDLNLPTDAWDQPCDVVVDKATRRYSDGEVTVSVTESGHVDGSKDYAAGLIESDVHMNSPSPSGAKAEASARNGKECQSGYDSQFEDGELREPYPWEEKEGDSGDVEQVDYGSEPENERVYSLAETNENKLEDVEQRFLPETKCDSGNVREGSSDVEKHVVVCMNDSHSKGSSPSRSFGSKPYKGLPSHESIPRRRPDSYEEPSDRDLGPNKFIGRDRSEMRMRSRSPARRPFGGWNTKRRFSPPIYRGGPKGFGHPRPKTVEEDRGMMNGFDQPGPGPHGYVRRQFSNGGYRGRFRRFPNGGGNRDFRGVDSPFPPSDGNNYPSRMHNNRVHNRRDRSNSPPVFRRLHDPQSRSRSRSRSPCSWNRRNRSPPGFKGDENRMERVRLPSQKRFPLDQEMGFLSPPRNQRNSRFFDGRNDDGGGENDHNNLRGRKSPPGRIFRRQQRFDSMRRVNSENNHFRPFMRHNNNNRKFVDGEGSRGGGCKYEGAEEEKNGNMYEMVHRPLHHPRRLEAMGEDSDNIRRFRLNAEQQQQHSVVSINNGAS
ncbi:hypothetical protein CARUB_v10004120mg [Capsella rubella]|uniref:Uncharacterized protein n=1 Tax=Capsella rubella TaxID=81985 RepID=R0F2Z8_9BRAS|nr:uncharacterized protein LOC17880710 [Capsella rubella]EOA16002.1 hypothetical protein CARUB_v10004120mg [Capsella rubella]